MDALTQIVLGASVAAAIAPARHRRAALLAGGALGTLPDLDIFPLMLIADPVEEVVQHRGASHSLLVLPFLGLAIFAFFKRLGGRVAESPRRWHLAIQGALVTHPILDAFTVYGTQLLWPIPFHPMMWSSVFIIDPLYTIWLLIGCVAAWRLRERDAARRWLVLGLALSTAYLGWSLVAKGIVERHAARALAAADLGDAPRFSVPTPFNTLLWRVVAVTPDGHVEALWSLVSDRGPMHFESFASDAEAHEAVRDFRAVRRLTWWNRGFVSVRVADERAVLHDLRMGLEPDYFFSYEVAERRDGVWHEIPPRRTIAGRATVRHLEDLWDRLWRSPRS